jgi:diguanylate cyclase (GGDEF)-like protein
VHEVNTAATGEDPGSRMPTWAGRSRAPGPVGSSPAPGRWILAASRLIFVFTIFAIAALLFGAVFGYGLAHQNDTRLASEQHSALRNAVAEFRAPFSQSGEINPGLVRVAEHVAGVKNLKFERDPDIGDREMRPVIDSAVLFGFAALSLWQLKRARRELTEREAQAARAADEDKLTGLSNHGKTLELLDLALAERRDEDWTTFALIELDGLEDVTAHHGVMGSDELIVAVARRLKQVLPVHAMCGRIASDTFAMVLTAAPDVDIEGILCASLQSIARPHWVDNVVRISAHAGFAQAPGHATTRGELTRRANLALRTAAKKGPGSIVGFDIAIDTTSNDQKFIHRELPRAISANELEVHYQPIVSSQGGRMVGVEALLRWTHATRGAIQPTTFIPIAEQMGLMDTIGAFVLHRTLQDARQWPDDLYVAVNLSPLQVRDRTIVDMVRSALAESGVAPSRLVLEITEGVLIDDPDEMVKRINDLHALGVRVALDDFGSGYSNLGYLQRFPLDKLKIDRSFVAALGRSSNGGVIIQAIVALGRALGLSVLVEGVETEHQRVLLRLAGCDEMQGFLFARPAPAKAIDKLLVLKQGGRPLSAADEALTA